jgi:hypothetical protein
MSNINYSDYNNLIENNFKERRLANSLYLCNKSAINNNKDFFAISTKNNNNDKFKPTCLIGDNELELKQKDDIYIDTDATLGESDKMFRLYKVYKTPKFDKINCKKKINLNNCLTRTQISYFNDKINKIDDRIVDINTQKVFLEDDINVEKYSTDYNILRENQKKLYETEKRNFDNWTNFMKDMEVKLNERKEELNGKYSFAGRKKNNFIESPKIDKCNKIYKINKKETSLTNRQRIIQQQDEFNYKTSLINKLNILIIILIILLFITIIFYSDVATKIRKNMENNIKNFSNDFLL